MVIISLLDLPLELPPDAEARRYGLEAFTSGLPEYLSRCQCSVTLQETFALHMGR